MKIEIWDEDQKEEEQPLRLRLVRSKIASQGVTLYAVDAQGRKRNCGALLHISHDGYLGLRGCISVELGLKLDSHGCLEVSK